MQLGWGLLCLWRGRPQAVWGRATGSGEDQAARCPNQLLSPTPPWSGSLSKSRYYKNILLCFPPSLPHF